MYNTKAYSALREADFLPLLLRLNYWGRTPKKLYYSSEY